MESWIHDNLKGSEVIALSPTGYTNEAIAIAWLRHFIKHTHAGPTKQWKMLLLDGHITHENPDFVILAHENHIKPFEYPSHLTHVLQPLDVGVFRPWKHYHNKAIQKSIRSLDFEYTISSFFRDLSDIREQALKPHTIRNAFKDSGNWPPSYKAACKKMETLFHLRINLHIYIYYFAVLILGFPQFSQNATNRFRATIAFADY